MKKLRFIIDTHSFKLRNDNKVITSEITILREGTWKHKRYGVFTTTKELFSEFVSNFKEHSIGKDIAINLAHDPSKGAAGWIKKVFVEGKRLRALIEWTPLGVEMIKSKQFRYISAEYEESYTHPESDESLGGVLLGAALCIDPFVGNLDPVKLSVSVTEKDKEKIITVFHPDIFSRKKLNTVEDKIKAEEKRKEINDIFWTAESLISEAIHDEKLTIEEKKEKIKGIVDDFVNLIEGTDQKSSSNVNILTEGEEMKEKILARLRIALSTIMLSDRVSCGLMANAGTVITGNESKDEVSAFIDGQVKLAQTLATDAKQLNEDRGGGNKSLSADEIGLIVAEGIAASKKEDTAQAKKLSEQREANIKFLSDEIEKAEGIGEDDKKLLTEGLVLTITGNETEDQIKGMVSVQVKLTERAISNMSLSGMGYPVKGRVKVGSDEGDKGITQLSEDIDKKIMHFDEMHDSERYFNTGSLSKINERAAKKILSLYDKVYCRELAQEGVTGKKLLAGGQTGMGDTALPYTVMRTAVREAMYNLVAANFVAIDTESESNGGISPTVFIPTVKRQTGNPSIDNITTFEGQGISFAGLEQGNEMAYVNQRKLAVRFSNEVAFFSRANRIDFDAVRDSLTLVSKLISEGVERLLLTEIVQSTDEYSATSVTNEDLAAQTNASNTTFQLTNWPLCKPRKVYSLSGTQVGSTINPVTVTFKSVGILEYDGTGTQTAGDYYKISNYSLGQFQIVNEAGAIQTPAGADALTVSYNYTTNILKFDKNFASGTWGDHLNNLLNNFGRRKATLGQDRYSTPNYALMSMVLNNMITEATKFESAKQVDGQNLTNDGNLAMVKGIPCFGSNVPFPMMSDLRLIIGERFATKQKIVKPWSIDPNFTNAVDSTGKFIGKKQTYGEQYDAIHTPEFYKGKSTQIVVYDSTSDLGPF